ncbi:hypothetical protein MBLNU230_g7772t1 [Neophaeotheca triangularis]
MPPRIPILQCLRASNVPQPASLPRTSTQTCNASTVTQRRKHRDPYALAQARARKAANLSRQEVLKKERAATLGDPVHGVTTPFIRSFDTALPPEPSPPATRTHVRESQSPSSDAPGPRAEANEHLNFYVSKPELDESVKRSKWLTTPTEGFEDEVTNLMSGSTESSRKMEWESQQATAAEALRRIASLSLGSSKDRLRANKQRCIDVFGRQSTDKSLAPRLAATDPNGEGGARQMEKTPRVGPDTGSSEVQIAILTAKIRTLSEFLLSRGSSDKTNKRNLRLLVHRRQKLLKYLRRKERGGPRWTHLIETLGLTEGTWRGEISL